jgi:hypothetical protein
LSSDSVPSDDPNPAGQLSGAALSLYDGWMTGWSYEACRRLYFLHEDPNSLSGAERSTLLGWLSTYRNLVDAWGAVYVGGTRKELDEMEENVGGASRGAHHGEETITLDSFDSHFEEVKGGIRASAPYAYYTVLFASYASRLRFPRDGDAWPMLIGSMLIFLTNMKAILPPGAFDFIDDDLMGMRRAPHDLSVPPTGEADRALKQRIQVWSDLVFGTLAVGDALNGWGGALVVLSIVGASLGLFLVVGGIIFGLFDVIRMLPGFNAQALNSLSLSNLSSIIQTAVPTIAAVGLSTSLLVTRAWDAVESFEVWVAVQLAKIPALRRRNVYAMIS